MTISSLLIILIAMVAQSRPGICIVNGVEMLEKGKILQGNEKSLFLQGVALATTEMLDRASVKIHNIKGLVSDEKIIVCAQLDVNYDKQDNRADETYVVIYKQEPGIIDGMLAYHSGDMAYCNGRDFIPRNMDYQFYPRTSAVVRKDTRFDVKRQYEAAMGQNGGPLLSEEGTIICHYVIDNDGHIALAEEPIDYLIKHIEKPNASIPGRSFEDSRPRVTENNKPSMLGSHGLAIIDFFTQPVGMQNDEWLDQSNQYLENLSKGALPPGSVEQQHKAFMRWEKTMMYRDATLWLNWLKANNTTQLYQDFKMLLSEDEQFALWVKQQAAALKNKKDRNWWEKMLK